MPKLRGSEHPFVDHPIAGQDAHIELFARVGGQIVLTELDFIFSSLANQIKPAVEIFLLKKMSPKLRKNLTDSRLDSLGAWPDEVAVDRHVAPAEHLHAVVTGDALQNSFAQMTLNGILSEGTASPRRTDRPGGTNDVQLFAFPAEERIGSFDEDARAVTAVFFAAAGAAVVHVFKHVERIGDHLMRFFAFDMADKSDTAGVVFKGGIVQSLRFRQSIHGNGPGSMT